MNSSYLLTFLLNSLWQIPLIAAVAAAACYVLRNGPGSHRHTVWVAALVAAIVLPMASVRINEPTIAPELLTPQIPITKSVGNTVALPAIPERRPNISVRYSITTVFIGIYALFLAFGIFRFAWAFRRTWQTVQGASETAMPDIILNVLQRCQRAFGVRDVRLLCSSKISAPAVIGRTIILPEALMAETSEDVLATAIGHELAHIARRDYPLNVVYELASVLVAFHPATHWIRRGIERTREMACDEMVTQRVMNANAYARSMVSLAADMSGLPRPSHSLGVFDGDILEERIRRLLEGRAENLKRARLLLAGGLGALASCVVIASGLALSAHAQAPSQAEIATAVDDYNRGDYRSAVQHFEAAARLEPANLKTKLFLANALMRQFYAEKQSANQALVTSARQQYQAVLNVEPANRKALQGMLAVTSDSGQTAEAREWALRLIAADPNDKGAYYAVGTLDWALVYADYQKAKQATGGRVEEYFLPDANVRTSLRNQDGARLAEGLEMLGKAFALDPEYDDAAAYINLLYRLQGGIAETQPEGAELIAKADEWVGKALAIKKRKAAGPQQAAVKLDAEGPAPGPATRNTMVMAPPPPPPPPNDTGPATDAAIPGARNASEQPLPFWQVVGPTPAPARSLFQLLKDKGFNASMIRIVSDNKVRVLAGPYPEERLAEAKVKLEGNGFKALRVW